MFRHVLVLCAGNICRSPMAEAVFALGFKAKGVDVRSAGIGAVVGQSADPIALDLMAERGLDITAYRALQLTEEVLKRPDLVLVMESWQQRELERKYPLVTGRGHRLGKWGDFDVLDPYHQPRGSFELVLTDIDMGFEQWREKKWQ